MPITMISFDKALDFVRSVRALESTAIDPALALGMVLSSHVRAMVDSPPRDSSLKDGFALKASDIQKASRTAPVRMRVAGSLCAGQDRKLKVERGQAVRIMTGARIPEGADAVLPQEFTSYDDKVVDCFAPTQQGRNILRKGADLKKGQVLAEEGTRLTPGLVGLFVGAGVTEVEVFRYPRVVTIATGSELAEEGRLDESTKIFPSNRATIASWLKRMGIEPETRLCRDEYSDLRSLLATCMEDFDVVITSGGVLDGERDLVVSAFEELGVDFLFKRVTMGPGKGVCMGRKGKKLVFNLPGGPPSNYVAFLFIALPAVLRLMGIRESFPPRVEATLGCELRGRRDWTQLILARCGLRGGGFWVEPVEEPSRLKRIAFSNAVIVNPEGMSVLRAGDRVEIAILGLFS